MVFFFLLKTTLTTKFEISAKTQTLKRSVELYKKIGVLKNCKLNSNLKSRNVQEVNLTQNFTICVNTTISFYTHEPNENFEFVHFCNCKVLYFTFFNFNWQKTRFKNFQNSHIINFCKFR